MQLLVIINPNSSTATTEAMVALATQELAGSPDIQVQGLTATSGPPMITDAVSLQSAAAEVLQLAQQAYTQHGQALSALIVGAFGDPGLEQVRQSLAVPSTGLAESSIREASEGGRRFGIATTTPDLEEAMLKRVVALGAAPTFTGFRYTTGDPHAVVSDRNRLVNALTRAVRECTELDGADAVIIAGGPLASSTQEVADRVNVPLINPVVAACRQARQLMR